MSNVKFTGITQSVTIQLGAMIKGAEPTEVRGTSSSFVPTRVRVKFIHGEPVTVMLVGNRVLRNGQLGGITGCSYQVGLDPVPDWLGPILEPPGALNPLRDELREHMAHLNDRQPWENKSMLERALAVLEGHVCPEGT